MNDAEKLRRLRAEVREAVQWLGCVGPFPADGGDFCGSDECIRCNLKRALGSAYRWINT